MMLAGPPLQYWCMRFEARHNFFKEVARINRCFKNICKSLTKRAQYALACALMQQKMFTANTGCGPCTETVMCSLSGPSYDAAQAIGINACDTVYTCSWLALGHYRFYIGSSAVFSVREGYPQFGIVKDTFFSSKKCYFVVANFCYAQLLSTFMRTRYCKLIPTCAGLYLTLKITILVLCVMFKASNESSTSLFRLDT
jgi:hypothetical protein